MIEIFGASDDLIEIEGDFEEELNVYPDDDEKEYFLAVSDGTLLKVVYDGNWNFLLREKGTLFERIEEPEGEEYSQKVFFNSGIKWVAYTVDVVRDK
jgi:hypothetical protein